ncbi:MAG TPA: AAA family ATPase [Nitrospiria bacterium]
MTIFEVVLQEIRNFKQLTRLSFKPSLNIIQGDNGSGKTTLLESVVAGIFGSAWAPSKSLLSNDPSVTSQAGIVIKTSQGEIFRITRDFTNKRQALSKLDQSRKFVITEKEDTRILGFVQQELHGLQGDDIEKTSMLKRDGLPSFHSPNSKKNAVSSSKQDTSFTAPLPGPDPSVSPTEPSLSQEARDKRLTELMTMQEKAEKVLQIEEKLNNQRDKASDLKRRIRLWGEKIEELKTISAKEASLVLFSEAPPNLDEMAQAYEQSEKDQQPFLQEIDEEKTTLLNNLLTLPEINLLQNKFLWIGSGIIILNMGVGLAISLQGFLRHLFFLGFATGIGFILWSIWKDRDHSSKRSKLHDQIDQLYRKQEAQEEIFQKTYGPFLDFLKKTGCKNGAELREKIRGYRNLSRAKEDLEKQIRELLQENTPQALDEDFKKYSKEIEHLETQLKNLGDAPSDLYSIQDEIRKLKQGPTLDQTQMMQPPGPEIEKDLALSSTPTETGNSTHRLSFHLTPSIYEKVAPLDPGSMHATATTLLKRLAPVPLGELFLSPDGVVSIKGPDGSFLPWENLSSGTLDLTWVVLFLSGQGLLKDKHPFPLLLDDPFIGIDPKRQAALLDVLRALGRHRQVILCTTRTLPIKEGDHQIHL